MIEEGTWRKINNTKDLSKFIYCRKVYYCRGFHINSKEEFKMKLPVTEQQHPTKHRRLT